VSYAVRLYWFQKLAETRSEYAYELCDVPIGQALPILRNPSKDCPNLARSFGTVH